ncbi:MAG: DUF2280 domain-containing protein [Hyphomicrobiaceae bacterium]|nr:DUF2280 domain-containing protein [Hyphomicrobiaceae bacterium]
MARPSKLSEAVKTRIVTGLACFEAPSAIAEAILAEFGVAVSRQLVSGYDPGTAAGKRLAARWQSLFQETRARYTSDVAEVAVAHHAVRMRRLEALYHRAEAAGELALAAALLEQAAKDAGGAFTNRRAVDATLAHRPPVPTFPDGVSDLEAARIFGEFILEDRLAAGIN